MSDFYLYMAEWGYHGSCADPGDGGYYGFLTTVNEETMKERMRAAANELGDDYKHCEFLKAQTDGFGFDAEYQHQITPDWGWKPAAIIDLDEIKREDLWSEEKMSEILAERERIAAEKRRQEQEQKKKWAREKDQRELHRIMKEHPDLWNEARKWGVIE